MAAALRPRPSIAYELRRLVALACAMIALAGFGAGVRPAAAQFSEANPPWVGVPPTPKVPTASSRFETGQSDPNAQMLVRADELQYDNTNNRILAIGNVQIYYQRSTLEADKVVYEQTTKRMRAEGNARFTEADGKVVHGEIIDLTDQFRDGFVDSLQLEAADRTRFAAPRAERKEGRYTVFQSGVYTACEPCKDDPSKPPRWQVRATRIIHDDTEKMIYFEDARLEFLGFPMFYWPYLSTPDPTVKRKTGFLMPKLGYSTQYGLYASTPYFWALAPNYDLTLTPTLTSKQGLLMQAEWRHRLVNGSYSIKAAGIFQADKQYFADKFGPGSPGDRVFRGSIDTTGQFALNNNWVWGWDGTLVTDKMVIQDYGLRSYFAVMDPFKSGGLETVTQLYLTGRGERSYFDARGDVLLRPCGERRAKPASDRPPGRRLPQQARAAAVRRRTDLPRQHHEPFARRGRLRPDHADCVQYRTVRPVDRRSHLEDTGQLHPARLPRHLFTRLRRGDLAAHPDRSVRAEVDAIRHGACRHRGPLGQGRNRGEQLPSDRR